MVTKNLKPTDYNIKKTLKNDSILRNAGLFRFIKLLLLIEEGYTIALDGNWGSGKTFFVKQAKMVFDSFNFHKSSKKDYYRNIVNETLDKENNMVIDDIKIHGITSTDKDELIELLTSKPILTVYYDAWNNDNDIDPVLSIIYEIATEYKLDEYLEEDDDIMKIITIILSKTKLKDVIDIVNQIKPKDVLEKIKQQKQLKPIIDEYLTKIMQENGEHIVIFIDELDRCKPSYAVDVLECIKHYFDNENITFVFSTNINQLVHTIKAHYGQEYDASRYLDRFFDIRMSLPPIDKSLYIKQLKFKNNYYVCNKICRIIVDKFNFELREISRFYSMINIASYNYIFEKGKTGFANTDGKHFVSLYIVPILVGLKMTDINIYNECVEGKDCSPILDVLLDSRINSTVSAELNINLKDEDLSSLKTLLTDLYSIIFDMKNNETHEKKEIGSLFINNETYKFLISTLSLLSDISSFEFEGDSKND